MSNLDGTVVEGHVIPDEPIPFPDGTRVRIEFPSSLEMTAERENHLNALREGLAEIEAGETVLARDAMAELAAKYGFSPTPEN